MEVLMKKIFLFLALGLIISCDKTPGDPKNPLFSGTTYIEITGPTGNVSSSFTFIWQSPGTAYEIAGLFTNSIAVEGKKIINNNDCIALWATGYSGSAGNVPLSSFRKCVNGQPTSDLYGSLPGGGKVYYWAVWGEDEKLTVTHSSKTIAITN
jgi:hypothetical protein